MDDLKKIQDLIRARRKDIQELKKKRQRFQKGPEKVESVLLNIFKDNSEISKRIAESRAVMAWPNLVGNAAAQASTALKIRNNVLIVQVADPLWMQQLMLLKNSLLKKYRAAFPSLPLVDIFFTRS